MLQFERRVKALVRTGLAKKKESELDFFQTHFVSYLFICQSFEWFYWPGNELCIKGN